MDFNQIIAPLGLTSAELSRQLNVSDGHIGDLKSGRRKLSIKVAAKLERLTQRSDILPAVVAEKTAP